MGRDGMKLLFVCTGNLCRSPMAEGILRARLLEAEFADEVLIDSAGIHAAIGRAPEPLAVEAAAAYGADISDLSSRPFGPADFARFDHLIAMDLGHLDFLQATCPSAVTVDIRLLLDDVADFKKLEIPDPYRQDRDAYEFSARLINVGIDHLMKRLFRGRAVLSPTGS
jgi:low molecular weight protein-tyrosine phosphatase